MFGKADAPGRVPILTVPPKVHLPAVKVFAVSRRQAFESYAPYPDGRADGLLPAKDVPVPGVTQGH